MRLKFFSCSIVLALAFFVPALVVLALVVPTPLSAQSPIQVVSQTLDIQFPRSMHFAIEVKSASAIQALRLTVRQQGVALGSRYSPSFVPAPVVRAIYNWNFQSFGEGGYLPPGTHGDYTWHIADAAGNVYDTPPQPYTIDDSSQKWQVLANANLRVSWYDGPKSFGQAILDRAASARAFFANDLQVANVDPLEIYIYADKQAFFDSLPPFSAEWTGGRTFPEYDVIMINFAPDNLEWGLRATSHELSHAILHSKIRGTLGDLSLPHWLDEGLAVYNETNDHSPDPQFQDAFQAAVRHNMLIPLRSMEVQFPQDSNQALLAYGSSYSAVKFMVEEYGNAKFSELLNTYQRGAIPDEGLVQVYAMNQDQLENAWRKKIGAPLREISTSQLPTIPARPTYEFSSAVTTTPAPTVEASSTTEPTLVATNATPIPASTPEPQQPNVPASSLCGGVFGLGGLVVFSLRRRRKIR